MQSIKRKTGRPQAVYTTADGTRIPGLTRLSDGRWRLSGPEKTTFTEVDERLAILRFYELTQTDTTVGIPMRNVEPDDFSYIPPTGWVPPKTKVEQSDLWAYVREQIITRPKWVAEQVGIEQIGYLTNLSSPSDSPRLDTLIEVYAAKPDITKEEVTRCRRMWEEFVKVVGVKTLREITPESVEAYEKAVSRMGLAPKSVKHRYTRVRTVIAHALKRGKNREDCRQALDHLAMLEVATPDSLDPDPITVKDFWAIHAEAVKAGNTVFAAMMLFSLNCALYPSEAGAVRWSDIDLKRGEFVTRRRKTGVPRVGVLWPETVAALQALPTDRPAVFNAARVAYQRYSNFRDWTLYRTAAGLTDVTYAQIRDAAFTTACRGSVDQARVLAGHRLPGATDHYVLRDPRFVAPACAAIRAEFFAKRKAFKK